jgi:hypothetical protein
MFGLVHVKQKTSVIIIQVSPRTVRPTELRGSYFYVATSLSFLILATKRSYTHTQLAACTRLYYSLYHIFQEQ